MFAAIFRLRIATAVINPMQLRDERIRGFREHGDNVGNRLQCRSQTTDFLQYIATCFVFGMASRKRETAFFLVWERVSVRMQKGVAKASAANGYVHVATPTSVWLR